MKKHAVLQVRKHWLRHLMGINAMTVSRLSEISGAKIWLQPQPANEFYNVVVQGSPEQAKAAKANVLALCESLNAMENMELLPNVYNQWILQPSLNKRTTRWENDLVLPIPPRFAKQVRRIFQVLPSNNIISSVDQGLVVRFHAAGEQVEMARNFIFNELFFATHEQMKRVPFEHFDLLTRHSTGKRSEETVRYADGNTPFLMPRSKTIRVPSELVGLNTYGLSDFFAQLERKTQVVLTHTFKDVVPGEKDVSLFGDGDVIRAAWIPFLDQVDDFKEKYPTWQEQMRRGYLLQLGVSEEKVDEYMAEPFPDAIDSASEGDIVVVMDDEQIDEKFHVIATQKDVTWKRLPTKQRLQLTWEAVRSNVPSLPREINSLDQLAPFVEAMSDDSEAREMVKFAKRLESPKLADRLLEAVMEAKDLTWVTNRGPWRRRYERLVFRLKRQVGKRVLSGKVYVDTMQYLEDFTQLVRQEGLIFPKQELVDYVDEDELEDMESGELFKDIEDDDDDNDGQEFVSVPSAEKRSII